MSLESAKEFVERMMSDQEFNRQVSEFESAEDRMAFVKDQGFDFTPEEVKSVADGLSEADLDSMTGGGGCTFPRDFTCIALDTTPTCIAMDPAPCIPSDLP